jgi:hypothetical protein
MTETYRLLADWHIRDREGVPVTIPSGTPIRNVRHMELFTIPRVWDAEILAGDVWLTYQSRERPYLTTEGLLHAAADLNALLRGQDPTS